MQGGVKACSKPCQFEPRGDSWMTSLRLRPRCDNGGIVVRTMTMFNFKRRQCGGNDHNLVPTMTCANDDHVVVAGITNFMAPDEMKPMMLMKHHEMM